MTKFSLILLAAITQLLCGALARPDNYRLSEKQITKLKEIAMQWKEVINYDKNACEELYDYVCSNTDYPKPSSSSSDEILKDILNSKPELITEAEEKYLKYSTTCEELKLDEKEEFMKWFKLENSIGDWPAFVEKWDDSKFNLPLAIAEMNSYDYPIVFALALIFDADDNFKTLLQINKQDLIDIENEKDLFKSKFEKLGVKNPEDVLTDAVLFEKTFKEVTESLKSTTDKRIKFSELKEYLPEVDWDKQIEIIYGGKLPDDFAVLMKNHEELKKTYKAISKLSPKVISNYFFCAFVRNLSDRVYSRDRMFFMPVVKQAFMKHVYDKDTQEILKGMYVTTLEILQDKNIPQNIKTHYSAEQIAKFFDEEIFGLTNDEDLTKEFKEVSTNNGECVKNYHRLQKIFKKRSAKPFFNDKNALPSLINSEVSNDLVYYIPKFIEQPSPFMFQPVIFSIIPAVFETSSNTTIYPSETKDCFAKQFTEELTTDNMKIMLAAQLILKSFADWTKNYPDCVHEENKILQEYDLTAEKLLILSIEKLACRDREPFNMVMTALANSLEFSQFFDCPTGSKMNAVNKCKFW